MSKNYITHPFNGRVACWAPVRDVQEQKIVSGVRVNTRRSGLFGLKVAYDYQASNGGSIFRIFAGNVVYVQAELLDNQKWAVEPVEFKGQQLVFVPEAFIMLIGENDD